MKSNTKSSVFKLHILQSESNQTIQLENLSTRENLKFTSWNCLTRYLQARSQTGKKGLR